MLNLGYLFYSAAYNRGLRPASSTCLGAGRGFFFHDLLFCWYPAKPYLRCMYLRFVISFSPAEGKIQPPQGPPCALEYECYFDISLEASEKGVCRGFAEERNEGTQSGFSTKFI